MIDFSDSRPNVLLFICDDLAWGDLACHGNPHIRTPNLDRLHGESARFEHHCSGPLCSPARASLLTGRYHLRTRVIDTYSGRSIIDPAERTIAHDLSAAGYRCGAFGKWHLGDCFPSRAIDMGFHETVMHGAGGIGQPGDHPLNYDRWHVDSYFDPVLHHNGEPKTYTGYCSDIFTNEAIRFIDHSQNQPFFAYVASNAPHSPMIVAEEWTRHYLEQGLDPTHAKVYGMVENIDHNVGRIMDYLETKGLAENTILIFTSDHGPCPSADAADGRVRWNDGLRGRKSTLYQGGIKVPYFIRYPDGRVEPKAIKRVTSPIDTLPTLLDFCDVEHTDDKQKIDGISLRGLISENARTPPPPKSRDIYMQWHRGDVPIPHRNAAVIGDRYKYYTPDESSPGELYDLEDDPGEQKNIANEDPKRVATMRADYLRWLFEMAGTRGANTFDSQPIHIGSEAEQTTLLTTNDWRLVTGEGWNATYYRGYWRVKSLRPMCYDVCVRFKAKLPNDNATPTYLTVGDHTLKNGRVEPDGWIHFHQVRIEAGSIRIEAWRESTHPDPSLYLHRFESAFYIELCPSTKNYPEKSRETGQR